jgi:hypothetical protein
MRMAHQQHCETGVVTAPLNCQKVGALMMRGRRVHKEKYAVAIMVGYTIGLAK